MHPGDSKLSGSMYLNPFSSGTEAKLGRLSLNQETSIVEILEICRVIASFWFVDTRNVTNSWTFQLKDMYYFGPETPQMYTLTLEEILSILSTQCSSARILPVTSSEPFPSNLPDTNDEAKPEFLFRLTGFPDGPTVTPTSVISDLPSGSLSNSQAFVEKNRKKSHRGQRSATIDSSPNVTPSKDPSLSFLAPVSASLSQIQGFEDNLKDVFAFRRLEWDLCSPTRSPSSPSQRSDRVSSDRLTSCEFNYQSAFLRSGGIISGGSDPILVQMSHKIVPNTCTLRLFVTFANRTPLKIEHVRVLFTLSSGLNIPSQLERNMEVVLTLAEHQHTLIQKDIEILSPLDNVVTLTLFLSTQPYSFSYTPYVIKERPSNALQRVSTVNSGNIHDSPLIANDLSGVTSSNASGMISTGVGTPNQSSLSVNIIATSQVGPILLKPADASSVSNLASSPNTGSIMSAPSSFLPQNISSPPYVENRSSLLNDRPMTRITECAVFSCMV
jgi:hypothetical protein